MRDEMIKDEPDDNEDNFHLNDEEFVVRGISLEMAIDLHRGTGTPSLEVLKTAESFKHYLETGYPYGQPKIDEEIQ